MDTRVIWGLAPKAEEGVLTHLGAKGELFEYVKVCSEAIAIEYVISVKVGLRVVRV